MDQLRIGDADREEAVALLGEQYAQGRLTKDEFDERSAAAWSARTRSDLAPLFADLPVRAAGPTPAARPAYARPPRPGNGWHGVGRWVVPVFFVLLALTILTHLPLVLVAVLVWVVLSRRGGRRHAHAYAHHHGPHGRYRG